MENYTDDRYEDYVPRASRSRREAPPPRSKGKKNARVPLGVQIFRDLLLAGGILCVFSLFHHVVPRLTAKNAPVPEPVSIVTPSPSPTAAPTFTPVAEQTEEAAAVTPEPVDERTEWQKKFAEHFTDEVVKTDSSYTSPNVSVSISKEAFVSDSGQQTVYYVADIYVARIENFQTYFANGVLTYYGYQDPRQIAVDAGAVVSVNGDYADNQKEGFLVRNGQLYYSEQTTCDICVLYYDGTIVTYAPEDYTVEDVVAKGPYQSWKFGPALLDGNGQPLASFNIADEIVNENPRSALGYYEPGHYCFLLADGRQSFSRGLTMSEMAQVFSELGCRQAYNMDGGASAVMTFDGQIRNSPSNGGRDSGDILLIREVGEEENG